jgi:predicted transcriptional regulator
MKALAPHIGQHRLDCGPHLRALIEGAQVAQTEVAWALGISPRAMRRYLSGEVSAPYVVQFAVEAYCAAVLDEASSPRVLADESGAALARKANKLRREIEAAPTAALARQRAKRALKRIERVLDKRVGGLPSRPSR